MLLAAVSRGSPSRTLQTALLSRLAAATHIEVTGAAASSPDDDGTAAAVAATDMSAVGQAREEAAQPWAGGGEQAGENGGALLDGLMRADADGDGRVSRAEFVAFFRLRDGELRAAFDDMDLDGDGRVSSAELRQALVALDVRASDRQLRLLMTHLDRNGDGHISYGEFRGFFLLLPLRSAEAVFEYWSARHIDLGEDFLIPDDKEKHERDAGPGVVFTAGAVAGAVSRSVTAPFDRLKVMVRAAGEDLEGKEGEE